MGCVKRRIAVDVEFVRYSQKVVARTIAMVSIDGGLPPVVLTLKPLTTLRLAETLPAGHALQGYVFGNEGSAVLAALERSLQGKHAFCVPNLRTITTFPKLREGILTRLEHTGCSALYDAVSREGPDGIEDLSWGLGQLYVASRAELRRTHALLPPASIVCDGVAELGSRFAEMVGEGDVKLFCYGNSDVDVLRCTMAQSVVGESSRAWGVLDQMVDLTQSREFDPYWRDNGCKVPKLFAAVSAVAEQGVVEAQGCVDRSDAHNPLWDATALAVLVRALVPMGT